MPKLHELIPVAGQLKEQADKVRAELRSTFEKKTHHFTERTVSFKSFDEGATAVVEEQLDLQTTIPQELAWITPFLVKSVDVAYQVAEANTIARADVITEDGVTILSQIPATSLLELDKRMKEVRDLVTAIPTLDPTRGFRPDPDRGEGVFRAREERQTRTKKIQKPLTLSPATEKHAANVQLVTEDVGIGTITKLEWSGLITPAAKGQMLERVEMLTRAIREARARANEADISKNDKKIGAALVNYVFGQ